MSAHNTRDIAGLKFGRLIALRQIGHRKFPGGGAHAVWECRCDCGAITEKLVNSLVSGHIKSCGCYKRDNPTRLRHGHARKINGQSKTYRLWLSIRQRTSGCCERWQTSFENFLADMGEQPDGMTVDRIDNSRGYEPGNCRWATRTQQARNRGITLFVEFEGKQVTLAELAERHGLKYMTVYIRHQRGKRGAELIVPLRQYAGGHVVRTI
jgi:hypothetical protein